MSRDEVRKLLGEPLDVFGFAPDERLRYSRDEYGGPLDLGWHVRHLILSNDIVVLKLSAIDWWVPWDSPYNYKM